jgi:hypothetical protein
MVGGPLVRMDKRLLLATILLVASLSGCVSENRPAEQTGSPAPSSGAPSESSTPPQVPVNRAPNITLNASLANGTAPLLVFFNLTAVDDDQDNLTWTFDADADGIPEASNANSTLPATLNFTYVAAGIFNATFNVTDGNVSVNQRVSIEVLAAIEPDVYSGATTLPGLPTIRTTGAAGCAGFAAKSNGRDCYYWTLTKDYTGSKFEATSTASAPDLVFWSTCDAVSGQATGTFATASATETGTVPAGSGCAIMWNFGSGTGTMTLKIFP